MRQENGRALRTAGIFAGIGGLELGLEQAGHKTVALCEIMEEAQAVLRAASARSPHHATRAFENADLFKDLNSAEFIDWFLSSTEFDLVTAGFPCQDLSSVGRTVGIGGKNSSLICNLLDLIARRAPSRRPKWLLLENVPFMRTLQSGKGMRVVLSQLEKLGYCWAYRQIDAHCFGLPQRRVRLYILACLEGLGDPREVLLSGDNSTSLKKEQANWEENACGFYWTEGNRGLGWASDAVPTLKGGSGLGIPSPPAIMLTNQRLILPNIRDLERLQGFPGDWTKPVECLGPGKAKMRWKLVGNAVSVRVAKWIGEKLASPKPYDAQDDQRVPQFDKWPTSAWHMAGKSAIAHVGLNPVRAHCDGQLINFLREDPFVERKPLSIRATAGFLKRFERSNLLAREPQRREVLLSALRSHIQYMSIGSNSEQMMLNLHLD